MYRQMYVILFDAISEALQDLSEGEVDSAQWRLADAQRAAEVLFMECGDEKTLDGEE